MCVPVLLMRLAELSERRGQLSRMSGLVRKVALPVAIAAAALVGVSVVAGSVETQSGVKAETGQALPMTRSVVDDINWG